MTESFLLAISNTDFSETNYSLVAVLVVVMGFSKTAIPVHSNDW